LRCSVLVASAAAQTEAARATIPFAFTVDKRTLPAGDHRVSIDGSLLQVARIDGPGTASGMTTYTGGGPNQTANPRLVFRQAKPGSHPGFLSSIPFTAGLHAR